MKRQRYSVPTLGGSSQSRVEAVSDEAICFAPRVQRQPGAILPMARPSLWARIFKGN